MGRRYFYAIVDETHRQIERSTQESPNSWRGYENNPWYREARKKSGRI